MGRGGKAQGLTEGEVRRLCLYIDTNGPTWSQIRARNAKVTFRSVMRMGKDSLPKQLMTQLGLKNILVDNMVKKLGGGKVKEQHKRLAVDKCLTLNSVKPANRLKWKKRVQKEMAAEYKSWVATLYTQLQKDISKRKGYEMTRHVQGLGLGSAYLMGMVIDF